MRFLLFLFFSFHLIASENGSGFTAAVSSKIAEFQGDFEILAKTEKWDEILALGVIALDDAKKLGEIQEEAKICARLTSTCFYQGEYTKALEYVRRCHELSEELDPCLFLRALYLESAIYRAFAAKYDEKEGEELYLKAVEVGEKAANLYLDKKVDNVNLKGKIYFNLGAAHSDNPRGCLNKAKHCYTVALECFNHSRENEDAVRTCIRLGKVFLLQHEYNLAQEVIDEIRPLVSTKRVSMHLDYLEAQLRLALKDYAFVRQLAQEGFSKAEALGAKEDRLRFMNLLETIQLSDNCLP